MFNGHGSLASAAQITSGYRPALAVSAGLSILGAVVALAIRRAARPRPAAAVHPPALTSERLAAR